MTIVGIYSPWPQCGKSVVALALADKGFIIRPFAYPLKRMLQRLFEDLGIDYDTINEYLWGSKKHEEIPGLDVTSRFLQQTLGTEWGRNAVYPAFWTQVWGKRVIPGRDYVADDMRFPNEYDAIKRRGGIAVRITRQASKPKVPISHPSEGQLDSYSFDFEITNDGSMEELNKQVDDLLVRVSTPHLHY